MDMASVTQALGGLRVKPGISEMEIHRQIADALTKSGLPFIHEAAIAPRCRIDFLVGDIGLEVKCGKPATGQLRRQIARYAASERIASILVVVERSANLPATVGGKPLRVFGLNRLWGIAL